MKIKTILLGACLLFACVLFALHSNAQSGQYSDTVIEGNMTYLIKKQRPGTQYDSMAGYHLNDYLSKNLHYPDSARKNNTEGRVEVKFVVNEDGRISDCVISRGIGSGCDEEALRLVKTMPPWKPVVQNGSAIKVTRTISLYFDFDGWIIEAGRADR